MPSEGSTKRNQAAKRREAVRKENNDIGEIPPVADPDRRRACEADPALWLRTYHPEHFYLDFSRSQSEFISIAWDAITNRGYQNVNAYRAFGKSTIDSGLMELALLSGRVRYGFYVSAVDSMSEDTSKFFQENLFEPLNEDGQWEPESPLAQDYPEVCYPISARDGVAQKPITYHGRKCDIEMKPDRIRFPTILGSPANASLLLFTSIWAGNIRGKRHAIPGEGTFRPELAIIDDVQSDGTSKSEAQVNSIMETITKSIEGLGGYDRTTRRKVSIAILSVLTQNQPDDVAIRLLDRPEYCTKVYQFLSRTPDDFAPWRAYRDFRADVFRKHGQDKPGAWQKLKEYYTRHRTEIEHGCEVDNPEIYESTQVSAVHYALEFWCKSESAFWCELQNDAKRAAEEEGGALTPIIVQRKTRPCGVGEDADLPLKRWHIPRQSEIMTAFVDVGEHYLNYEVVAFGKNFEFAHTVDFGIFPDQNYPKTTKHSFRTDLQDIYHRGDKFDRLADAVNDCLTQVFEQQYFDAAGRPMNVHGETDYVQHAFLPGGRQKRFRFLSLCGVDCSDGEMEFALWGAVDAFHRKKAGEWMGRAIPCYGDEAQSRLMRYYDLKIGEWRRGRSDATACDWIECPHRTNALRRSFANVYASLLYDANTAKTRRDRAWLTGNDRPGAATLCGWQEAEYLRMYAEQQCSEEPRESWKSNTRYQRWSMKKPRVADNEFLDTNAGCWALANYVGVDYAANEAKNKRLMVRWE